MQNLTASSTVSWNDNAGTLEVYGNATISNNGGSNSASTNDSTIVAGDTYLNLPDYWGYHTYYYPTWFPSLQISEKSKIEQSFKIIQKLMEKKIIEELTVKKFIELVNEIASIL